jgi:hypothetical protein
MKVIRNTIYLSLFAFLLSSPILAAEEDTDTDTDAQQCCSCAFTQTEVFEPTEDFPCSFEYPAGWDVRYIPSENAVDIRAPRCETRCRGKRSLVFSVSKYKNNNAAAQEDMWHQIGVPVGRAECGGRAVTFFEPAGTEQEGESGMIAFLVGKHDGLDYDAKVMMACPAPGEWLELEKLIIDSLN